MGYNLEDVFKTTGIPEITYVEPKEYVSLVVAIRTKGKCVVVEGPSGIGKTTAVNKVLDSLNLREQCKLYSARKISDIPQIKCISEGNFEGIVIIDDFHRLSSDIQESVSNVMKLLADSSDENRKIIVIGINRVGDSLVSFSPDLNNRIATIRFEANPDDKVEELVNKGERALNFKFDKINMLVENARGSFHIAQLMCQTACVQKGILSTLDEYKVIHFSYPNVSASLMEEFSRSFFKIAREFATGNKLRREGRAPYLHVLKWLSESDSWSLDLVSAMQMHPEHKAGVIQIVEKGYLESFLKAHPSCAEFIHFDSISRILSVEDPKFMFYIRNINWNNFASDIGFLQLVEKPKYDFALSFAGQDRDIVKKVFEKLQVHEIAVFYDDNEQTDIISHDLEEYLYPIYNSEAAYVVPFLSKHYPGKVWTRFESNAFKERFGENAVIPIRFDDVQEAMFDETKNIAGICYKTKGDMEQETDRIVEMLAGVIAQYRERSSKKAS